MSEIKVDQVRDQFSKTVRAVWWLTLLRGVLLVVLGLYALFNPGMTLLVLAQVIGFYMMLEGCLALWAGITGQTPSRMWTLVRGALLVLAGLFFLAYPLIVTIVNTTMFVCIVAAFMVASGFLEIYAAIRDRKQIEGEGWLILCGAVAILFGLLMFAAPMQFGMLMVRIVGAFAIIAGIATIVASFRIRNFGKRFSG